MFFSKVRPSLPLLPLPPQPKHLRTHPPAQPRKSNGPTHTSWHPCSWASLFHAQPLLKALPTLLSCATMMLTIKRSASPLALPAVLVGIVLAFHAVLWGLGLTLADAQRGGWVMKPSVRGVCVSWGGERVEWGV
jgi:hypothetical protein